jgi:ferredoxin
MSPDGASDDIAAREGFLDRLMPTTLHSNTLKTIARDCGADDCGVVSIDAPALDGERGYVLAAFPPARTYLSLIGRMHREPVRSPARSIANLEFHRAGHDINETARRIVRQLEDMGIPALDPGVAFPMELDDFPGRGWVVSHKLVAQAAGLGRMGIHRSLIHPRYGSFVLLATVLIGANVDTADAPLDDSPCLGCKLCVAACPVGAIKPDGHFDFSACLTHNYQQFLGGFANWVEDVAASHSAEDYGRRVPYDETVKRWQSLSYGPTYNAAYCIAVCPAGSDVIGPYIANKKAHIDAVMSPLIAKREPVYVARNSDAADHVARRFPHKRLRFVRPAGHVTTIDNFMFGARLSFQRGKAKGLRATYHFTFTRRGTQDRHVTFAIAEQRLTVTDAHEGKPDLRITANAETWVRFLNKRVSLVRVLLTGAIRLRGSPLLLAKFGRCFPT